MLAEKLIETKGQTRARRYTLKVLNALNETFALASGLSEDSVWRQKVAPLMSDLPANLQYICQHGFTEIFNNAIEHSNASTIDVTITRTAAMVTMLIHDSGIGIFKKIMDTYHLEDIRHAIFELTKGKLTTDPKFHSGEGIFFTSRLFDVFMVNSDDLALVSVPTNHDWLVDIEQRPEIKGTSVLMNISAHSQRTFREVADKFAAGEQDYGFSRTCIPLKLAKFGMEQLVSRSQARRVLMRANRFKEVVLDFVGVETIGQAFADEIFGIFERDNPDVHLVPTNTNPEIDGMIKHVREARSGQETELQEPTPFLRGFEPEQKAASTQEHLDDPILHV